ncbi:MAG: hypothetical protein O9345_16245 [Burkholderiaceae bacterium]|nr:hypothetical protein [Burkholderiales bacterium]MCZ8339677.1 hypothetical protein [Burkholderiaceae bacterium]
MSDGDLLQAYDNAVGDSDDHRAGRRAVERAAREDQREKCARLCENWAWALGGDKARELAKLIRAGDA